MGKSLYLECSSGISGDMTVAALLDLGADREAMERMLATLPLEGYRVEITRVTKAGLDMCDFNVILEEDNHDHDMEYLHGHDHPAQDGVPHEHHHHHDHDHHDHHHHHSHRGLPEILHILSHGDMTPSAHALAERIFTLLAQAEAKAHGVAVEQVHFHEVGAVDSIVDIAAAAVLMDSLGVEQVIVPRLCEGTGTVRCQHGILPVPVPAVVHLAEAGGLPLTIIPVQGELVTPTGAAFAAAVMTGQKLPARFRVLATGMGAGKRQYERPSFLRAMLIEEPEEEEDTILKLETNLDDCTGEALGHVMEHLMEAGARDVFYTPVYMKKNRPGWLLSVICTPAQREALERIIFTDTTTIGIRRQRMERSVLPRESLTVQTALGEAAIKRIQTPEGERRSVEYESAKRICRETGRSFQSVMEQLNREI